MQRRHFAIEAAHKGLRVLQVCSFNTCYSCNTCRFQRGAAVYEVAEREVELPVRAAAAAQALLLH